MKVKVTKDNGLLEEGDILLWNDLTKSYDLSKTEENQGENFSESSSKFYSITEQGVLDNGDFFVFLTEEGEEIELEEDLDRIEENENIDYRLAQLEKNVGIGADITHEFKRELKDDIANLNKKIEDLERRIADINSVKFSNFNAWPFKSYNVLY